LSNSPAIPHPPLWTHQTAWAVAALAAIVLSLAATGLFRQDLVNWSGFPLLWEFCRASLQPDFSLSFLQLTGRATLITLAYAICGTAFSLALGFVGGVLLSDAWWQAVSPQRPTPARPFLRGLLALPRAIHELIWGLFFLNILGLDPLVGILGIAIPYGAIVARVFANLLDETPRQPLQSLISSGANPASAFFYTLLPQAFLDLLSYSFYRFECSIRSAAVLGIIGAGGLGYEIQLSLQSQHYDQLWTLFYALMGLNGLVDITSAVWRQHLGSPSRLDLNWRRKSRLSATTPSTHAWFHSWLPPIAIALLLPLSLKILNPDYSRLWSPRTIKLLVDLGQSTWPPALTPESLQNLAVLSIQTLAMSILAIVFAGAGGVVLAFPAAHNFFRPSGILGGGQPSKGLWGWAWASLISARLILLLCRAIPAPIWALVLLYVLFPGILPGAIALGLHNLGILGRLMAEVIENLDRRPLIALKAQGAPALLIFLYGVVPTTFTRFLAYILYRWEVCLRETVIVGLVGAGGLGRLLTEQLSSLDYRGLLLSLTSFFILTFAVDWVSEAWRKSLR